MCHNKKECKCNCKTKKVIKEALNVDRIGDDILSIHFEDVIKGDCILDIEKFENGTVSITLNDKPDTMVHFDSFSELVAYMGNDSVSEWNSKLPKEIFFNDEVMEAIGEFIHEPALNEAAKPTKKIIIYVRDQENTISELLNSIKKIGNGGHGFEIEMDKELQSENDEKGIKTHFYWDGDGGDAITDIETEDIKEGEKKEDLKEDAPGYLIPGINEAKINSLDRDKKEIADLFIKHYKLANKLEKLTNGKFMGFNKEETDLNKQVQKLKNDAWELARKRGLDTNEIMRIDKEAKLKAENKKRMTENEEADYYEKFANDLRKNGEYHGAKIMDGKAKAAKDGRLKDGEIITEASKINLKLTSNTKRELIKRAKVALDAIYSIYDICERLSIENKQFTDNLDDAFSGTNEMLTVLVCQDSMEKR